MTEQESLRHRDITDAEVEQLLAIALQSKGLGPDAEARIRAVTEREWRCVSARLRRDRERRRWVVTSLAASVAIIAITGLWVQRLRIASPIFGSIDRSYGRGIDARREQRHHRTLGPGDAVQVGDVLLAVGAAEITLAGGGTVRIAEHSSITIQTAGNIRLDDGTVYVDLPPPPARQASVAVSTPFGVVEHVGTAFEVRSNESGVRIRVREGRIRLLTASTASIGANLVTADAGTELFASASGVIRRPVATFGAEWLWISELAPTFEIEGKSLLSFLEWVGRESGRRLEFADPRVRFTADKTILHGSIGHHTPLDALSSVLATTSLHCVLIGDTIRVDRVEL